MLDIRPVSPDRFVLYENAAYAGGVTVYRTDDAFSIGILIVPAKRRQGLALEALRQIAAAYFDAGFALCRNFVAPENAASIRLHERAGFARAGSASIDGKPALIFEKRAPGPSVVQHPLDDEPRARLRLVVYLADVLSDDAQA
ncbi:GNAT family N-acetyltransferase [Beduinella massiliensis]|uniref:GNAT family N-acetyltransferase n=1 Tax=Beduinella massiliensis TaxID=1852363 RepID=UPI0031F88268